MQHFLDPLGKIGKEYVKKQSQLFHGYAKETLIVGVAMKAVMLTPLLLLQKPHVTPKSKDHMRCL